MAAPIRGCCQRIKKPANPQIPLAHPASPRGKAGGWAEEQCGLLDAGKTGSAEGRRWNPARLRSPLHARYPVLRTWTLARYRFQCRCCRHAQTQSHGSVSERWKTTLPPAPSTTPPMGGVVFQWRVRVSFFLGPVTLTFLRARHADRAVHGCHDLRPGQFSACPQNHQTICACPRQVCLRTPPLP